MKYFTTFIVLVSLINFVNLLDIALSNHFYKANVVVISKFKIADNSNKDSVTFKGYRAPAIISHQ
jgi:hypothetical protein